MAGPTITAVARTGVAGNQNVWHRDALVSSPAKQNSPDVDYTIVMLASATRWRRAGSCLLCDTIPDQGVPVVVEDFGGLNKYTESSFCIRCLQPLGPHRCNHLALSVDESLALNEVLCGRGVEGLRS
jgi:hypothetical protein